MVSDSVRHWEFTMMLWGGASSLAVLAHVPVQQRAQSKMPEWATRQHKSNYPNGILHTNTKEQLFHMCSTFGLKISWSSGGGVSYGRLGPGPRQSIWSLT
jgi:hypothetical protein